MKIDPTRSAGAAGAGRRADPARGEGFTLPTGESRPAAQAAAAGPVLATDALLALQIDGGGGRRRRQAERGRQTLNALDALHAGLLSGAPAAQSLSALAAHLAGREPTGDSGLDGVLQEIDVRAAVELAKRERRGARRA